MTIEEFRKKYGTDYLVYILARLEETILEKMSSHELRPVRIMHPLNLVRNGLQVAKDLAVALEEDANHPRGT